AACYEAEEDYGAAIEKVDPIAHDPATFLREQALLQLIRLHRLNSDPDQAGQAFETLSSDFPDSPFLDFARALIK
ncbi:MAG: tetratricopeptide repeat protein, partial [Desulfobacteraceae bacterium]